MRIFSGIVPITFSGLIIIVLFAVPFISSSPADYLREMITSNSVASALAFISFMFVATVIAPIAALPLVPIVAPLFGPYLTALYAIIGWGAGAIVAFALARHIGRPLLSKFISLTTVEQYEKRLPPNLTFWWLVFLRMIIPVDILSYAVGFVSTMSFWTYTVATFIGITPFALIFSFGGMMFFEEKYLALFIFFALILIILTSIFYYLAKKWPQK